MKVKTFTQALQIFHVSTELEQLDKQVNEFLAAAPGRTVVSVSDTTTVGDAGTIGVIRVLAYDE